MLLGFVYFYILFCISSPVTGSSNGGIRKLCFVSLVFRHGDRAPMGPYPKDPHSDVSHWPDGWGQLTKLGRLQQYELGKWIRHRYWDFLPLRYNASDIYVRSTDVDRTLSSAYCNLAGLYECWNEAESDGLSWQPIPVHTMPVESDAVLAGHKRCPKYEDLLRDALTSEEVTYTNEYYQDAFRNLSKHTGLNITCVRDCPYLYGTLLIQNLHGLPLPEWTKCYFPQPLQEMAEFAFRIACFTTPMKRLKCGLLVKEIIEHMEEKREGRMRQKLWMYSGHDTTLANLMQCLGVYDGSLPGFASLLIVELHRMDDEYCVSVFYKTQTSFKSLRLPRCECCCTLEQFKRVLKPVIPVDWERECMKH